MAPEIANAIIEEITIALACQAAVVVTVAIIGIIAPKEKAQAEAIEACKGLAKSS